MGQDLEKVLLTEEQILNRLDELAAAIDADYAGRDPLLVGVLKGAVMVMADLSRRLSLPAETDWMAISSYGSGTKSSGVVRILKDLERDITGRDVLIVEDIVDSGLTLSWIMANLGSRGPTSVEVCTLLRKPDVAEGRCPVASTSDSTSRTSSSSATASTTPSAIATSGSSAPWRRTSTRLRPVGR